MPIDALRDVVAGDAALGDLDRARVPRAALDADRPRRRAHRRRLGYSPDTRRLRDFARPQPHAAPLGRPGEGPGGGRAGAAAAASPRRRPRSSSGATRCCAARATRSWPRRSACARRGPADARGRPRGRRRRPVGPRGLGLRRLGGPGTVTVDAVATGGQAGTTIADRELPRLPGRHLRRRAGRPRRGPGAALRRADQRARPRRRRSSSAAATTSSGSTTAPRCPAHGDRRHRRALPPAAGAAARGVRGDEHLLRRHARSRGACARATRSPSSAAATPPARRRCSSPSTSRASR